MKKGCWKDSEVKALFEVVENIKNSGKPLKTAFKLHAEKFRRKPNSVRNYYYHEIDALEKDSDRCGRVGVDLKNHQKNEINYFSKEEEQKLLDEIKRQVEIEGVSVRKACLNLAGGDVETMLRYQNKYRNYIAKQTLPDNVIAFRKPIKKNVLSEGDINSLFMGLVRLVKRSAVEEYVQKEKKDEVDKEAMLQRTIVDLNRREKEISELKKQFLALKLENSKLVQSMRRLRCDRISKHPESVN